MRVGIVGNGVVGGATAKACLDAGHKVLIYDVDPDRGVHPRAEVYGCDVVFVCLPTPADEETGGLDTSVLDAELSTLPAGHGVVVIKSTVPVGYTRKLAHRLSDPHIVYSPEFLTARTAEEDAKRPRLYVVGVPFGVWPVGNFETHPACKILDLYVSLRTFYDVKTKVTVIRSDEAEMVKLAMNSWFGVKVAFWNEMHNLCDRLGLRYENVRSTVVAEGRVHDLHTHVPGPDGMYGFGGACLPKDLAEMVGELAAFYDDGRGEHAGVTTVCRAALERNELDRKRGAK